MNEPRINASDLIAGARRLAELYPDAVYDNTEACLYNRGKVYGGPPVEGCILGQAMREISHDFYAKHCGCRNGIRHEQFLNVIDRTDDGNEIEWLGRVQDKQDAGSTWGAAVKAADKRWPLPVEVKPVALPAECPQERVVG
jgi:hypothetical protein